MLDEKLLSVVQSIFLGRKNMWKILGDESNIAVCEQALQIVSDVRKLETVVPEEDYVAYNEIYLELVSLRSTGSDVGMSDLIDICNKLEALIKKLNVL